MKNSYCDIQDNCEIVNKLKAENEELKNIINEAKNSKLDLKSFLVGEAVQNEYLDENEKLKQTLIEIRNIAELHAPRCNDSADCDFECEACHLRDLKQILHKISEVQYGQG